MAGRERELKVVVTGEDRGATRALGKVETAAQKVGPAGDVANRSLQSLTGTLTSRLGPAAGPAAAALDKVSHSATAAGASLGTRVAGGAALGGLALGAFAAAGVGAASDLDEALNRSNAVFGEHGKSVERWADGAARDFGQSKRAALDAAGGFGNMFTQLDIGQKPAADMSMAMVELASDFASFHNADVSEVVNAQAAAFRGEYDAVQRFVPTINAAAVEQQALKMGLADSTKALDAQDKALATISLLMSGAGKATGDFDRTAGDLANTQRTLAGQTEDVSGKLGKLATPVLSDLARGAVWTADGVSWLADRIASLGLDSETTGERIGWLVRKLTPLPDKAKEASAAFIHHGAAAKKLGKEITGTAEDFKAIGDAQDRYTATQEKLAKAEAEAAAGPAKAARAREDAARAIADAERSVADAQRGAADAQENLNEARQQAAEDLDDLRRAQERNAVAEERAALNVDKARQDIGKAKTISEEKDARIGLREAELSLADAQERRREDAEALNAAEAAGVEGSRRVIEAKRGVQDAIRAVGDAERAVADAQQAAADSAKASLDDQAERTQAVRDLVRELAEAWKAVEAAVKKAGLAQIDIGSFGRAFLPPGLFPPALIAKPPGRAHGGPVEAGVLYEVNEGARQEYFRPSTSGNVLPLRPAGMDQPAAMARPAAPELPPITINFQVVGELDAWTRFHMRNTGREVVNEMMDEINRRIGAS